MGLFSSVNVRMQFKLGIYETRQITRVEHGGVVIDGIRYELSPKEWLFYIFQFCSDDSFRKLIKNELYYDYYPKFKQDFHSMGYSCYFAIFKNGHSTGYIVREIHFSRPNPDAIGEYRTIFYSGFHINQLAISRYNDTKNHFLKPIYYTNSKDDAAICMLSDEEGFERVDMMLELAKLKNDYDANHGAYLLQTTLAKQLQDIGS